VPHFFQIVQHNVKPAQVIYFDHFIPPISLIGSTLCSQIVLSFISLFVHYQICEHDILKTNKPILMIIGTSGPRNKGMKCNIGVKRSKVKVARGQR